MRGLKSESAILLNIGCQGRTPRWVRGLKYFLLPFTFPLYSVAPHDGCVDWNLAFQNLRFQFFQSHPTMGAWIEINLMLSPPLKINRRTPRWVRGLKYNFCIYLLNLHKSHPTMGAWIEICSFFLSLYAYFVAPHDGCVDWNSRLTIFSHTSLGRTPRWVRGLKFIKEVAVVTLIRSHPTMGAWIEIYLEYISAPLRCCRTPRWVRGLKSWFCPCFPWWNRRSHPTMGAWIEIYFLAPVLQSFLSRTPRWVRGLKFFDLIQLFCILLVAPHDGCVDWNLWCE